MRTKSDPKSQVTVRLSAAIVAYIDEQVASGAVDSRAAFLDHAAERQRRADLAARDVEILMGAQDKDDLDDLAAWNLAHLGGLD